jgi:hypothetical protein
MTGILAVDTADLARLAERIRLAAAEAHAACADPGPLQASIGRLAAPCLVHGTATFLERWTGALADLVDDARRLADAIDLVARSYRDVEAANSRLMAP